MNAIELRKTNGVAAVARDDLGDWERMRAQAHSLVQSGFLPKAINTAEKALAIIQTGKELGLGPMQALRSIFILDGKPVMSADLIGALMLSRLPGSTLRVSVSTDKICTVLAGRPGQPLTEFSFTIEDAAKAQLTSKDNWRKYPRPMLRARAITEAVRATAPDAILGIYDPDELGAVTSPSGEIIELPEPLPKVHPYGDTHTEQGEVIDFGDPQRPMEMIKASEALLAAGDLHAARKLLGSKASRIEGSVAVVIQAEREANNISPDYYKDLCKNWQRLNRALEKAEEAERKRSLNADVTESFRDEPEGADDRQPGED